MFEIGNIVEIVDRKTYMERGQTCTDDCALVAYSGCLCRVMDYYNKGYKLEPVDDFEPDPKFHVNCISFPPETPTAIRSPARIIS